MRYYIAVDKRSGNNRYTFVSMNILAKLTNDKELEKDNNLKAIYNFTTNFYSAKDLRDYLISNKLLPTSFKYDSLYIIYEIKENGNSYFHSLPIAYKNDKHYFSFRYIPKMVVDKNRVDDTYLKKFVDIFKDNFNLSEEYYLLKSYSEGYASDDKIYSLVQDLINKTCYVKRGNTYNFSFRKFYEIAMKMVFIDSQEKLKKIQEVKPIITEQKLNAVQQIEEEYLLDRSKKINDEQTRLF